MAWHSTFDVSDPTVWWVSFWKHHDPGSVVGISPRPLVCSFQQLENCKPKMQPPSDRGVDDLSVLVKMHQDLTIFQQNVLGRLSWYKMDAVFFDR